MSAYTPTTDEPAHRTIGRKVPITEVAVGALARFPIIPAAPLFASHRDLEWTFANVPVYEENRVKKVEACYRQLLKAME
jgi:hypothetical protein